MRHLQSGTYRQEREARYANYFEIGRNAFEFVIDFGQRYEGDEEAKMHTRIVTGPAYAKALLSTLQGAIEAYEAEYGAIEAWIEDGDLD